MINKQLHNAPKAVLFDWDSTLVDSLPLVHEALNHALVRYDSPAWSLEETQIKIHQSFREYLPILFPKNWEEVIKVYRERYLELNPDLKPFPLAIEVLELLKERGVYTALVSNKRGDILREELIRLNFHDYFSKVIGSEDLSKDKPHPITVHTALEATNIIPEQHPVWFVGDSVTDMETAHNSKCIPVFFGSDDHAGERYAHCRPKICFANHQEMLTYLKQIIS
jgi:phosphoglycolate phosphatase